MSTASVDHKFWTCKYDRVFKSIMLGTNNYLFIKKVLNSLIGDIKIINEHPSEIKIDNVKNKNKFLDCILNCEGKVINIEVNTASSKTIKFRNFNYFASLLGNYMKIGDEYQQYQNYEYYQVNISYGLSKNKPIIGNYELYEYEYNERYLKNVKIIEVNMDLLKTKWYEEGSKISEKYKYLLMQDMNLEELDKLIKETKGDKIIMAYKEAIARMNVPKGIMDDWDYEKESIWLDRALKAEYREEGLAEGRKDAQISFAKNLIHKHMPLKFIQETTELSYEQIKQLMKEK